MVDNNPTEDQPTALVTGGARRIGAAIVRGLHADGMNLIIHYRNSAKEAEALESELNTIRPRSAHVLQGDLTALPTIERMAQETVDLFGGLNLLVNNASSFFPTPIPTHKHNSDKAVTEQQWAELMETNLKAPFFLSQALAPTLTERKGVIINLTDIYVQRPLANHALYAISKGGLTTLTRALARDLGPAVRVNAIAPGALLWPEIRNRSREARIGKNTPLGNRGGPEDIVEMVRFLAHRATYITGQTVPVDGGRSIAS